MMKQLLRELATRWGPDMEREWENVAEKLHEGREDKIRCARKAKASPASHRVDEAAVQFSAHAKQRIHQRGLSREDIALVLRYGRRYFAADAQIYFLGDRDLPSTAEPALERVRGAGVVMSPVRPTVITAWRNRRHGMRTIRRKLSAGSRFRHRGSELLWGV